ncbi:MAG: hypothetical protein U0075_25055 [Thermomicrobiales bacterium]
MRRLSFLSQLAAGRTLRVCAWSLAARHLTALFALLLLPIPMHTGTELPHQDALFALLLDASDGVIDHQLGAAQNAHVHDAGADARLDHHGETPAFGNSLRAQGGGGVIALVTTSVLLLALPAGTTMRIWPKPRPRWGNIPVLEPPPPRLAS